MAAFIGLSQIRHEEDFLGEFIPPASAKLIEPVVSTNANDLKQAFGGAFKWYSANETAEPSVKPKSEKARSEKVGLARLTDLLFEEEEEEVPALNESALNHIFPSVSQQVSQPTPQISNPHISSGPVAQINSAEPVNFTGMNLTDKMNTLFSQLTDTLAKPNLTQQEREEISFKLAALKELAMLAASMK
jgi:hypothetical protein